MLSLPSQSVCISFFTSFSFQTYFTAMSILMGAGTLASNKLATTFYKFKFILYASQVEELNYEVETKKVHFLCKHLS